MSERGLGSPQPDTTASAGFGTVSTDLFAPCALCHHDPKNIVLDPEVWAKIIFAAEDSEDWRLRTLIEQAVMGPKR